MQWLGLAGPTCVLVPLILEIRCAACEWSERRSNVRCVALDSQGQEVVLRHPLENSELARLAGVPEDEALKVWRSWRAQGRIYIETAGICLACGARGEYRNFSGVRCIQCGDDAVAPMAGRDGCWIPVMLGVAMVLGGLWQGWESASVFGGVMVITSAVEVYRWLRWRRRVAALPCPQCGCAGLTIGSVGIS